MTAKGKGRDLMRQLGYEVSRYPESSPGYVLCRALLSVQPGIVLDVGANGGGYALDLRRFGFRGRIASFEPGREAFERLRRAALADLMWDVFPFALGDEEGYFELGIAANQGASSSMLPMLERHSAAAPDATILATETVLVRTLDDVFSEFGEQWVRPVMKIDVQGFEQNVLSGAIGGFLDQCLAIQLELSTVQLYGGSWDWISAATWLQERGFWLRGVEPGFSDKSTGEMLQFDGVFVRDTEVHA